MAIAEFCPVPDTPLDLLELRHKRRDAALHQLAHAAIERHLAREETLLLASLQWRERIGTTAIGRGVALPSAHSLLVRRPFVLIGRSRNGLDWDAPDGEPVRLVVFVLTAGEAPADRHFQRVACWAHALRLQRNRQRVLDAAGAGAVAAQLREALV